MTYTLVTTMDRSLQSQRVIDVMRHKNTNQDHSISFRGATESC